MTDDRTSIMQRLKAETSDLHSHAESRTLQRAIAAGEVDRAVFSAYLGQLYQVHQSLESALENSCDEHAAIGALATADRMRIPDLDRDLEFYGVDRDQIAAGDAAKRFASQVQEITTTAPVALLGALYVLEGSTNGGLSWPGYCARVGASMAKVFPTSTPTATNSLKSGRTSSARWTRHHSKPIRRTPSSRWPRQPSSRSPRSRTRCRNSSDSKRGQSPISPPATERRRCRRCTKRSVRSTPRCGS